MKNDPEGNPSSKFADRYTVIEVIASKKSKKTSIVRDHKGTYFIAKKIYLTDQQALNEIEMMRAIKHPNIVAFHDLIVEKEHLYLIEEFCEEGDLHFHIRRQIRKKRTYFSEEQVSKWLLQLLLAIEYLHNSKILHRDIRPQNIFLTTRGNLKLGSFRLSKIFEGQRDLAITVIGSPYYMSPEYVQHQAYDFKIDIWAYGCVLYEMCSLMPIYNSKNIVEVANNIIKGKTEQLPKQFSRNLNMILQRCLTTKPYDRPSAKDLLRTPYFLDVMKNVIAQKHHPVGQHRIPIKMYKVHVKMLQNKKNPKGTPKIPKPKEKSKIDSSEKISLLPKIHEAQTTKIQRKSVSKTQKDRSIQKIREQSKEKVKQLEEKIKRSRIRSRSRELARGNSRQFEKQKMEQEQPNQCYLKIRNPFSSRQKTKNDSSHQKNTRKLSSRQKKSVGKTKTEKDQFESPSSSRMLAPPPILPKVSQKNMSKSDEKMDLSETRKKDELQKDLAMFKLAQDTGQVKDKLDKIFSDLNIGLDDEEQFSFDLQDDENMARLTLKQGDGGQLLSTYKTKLAQLIEEINFKYCPNMETIQQKTQEFDSNTFANALHPK